MNLFASQFYRQVRNRSLRPFGSSVARPYTSDEYQYLQRSELPTMCFQASLLRLPIPKLEDSCQKYLNAQLPLLKQDEFEYTKSCVQDFLGKDGQELQQILKKVDRHKKHTSYISEYWFDMYLSDRKPLPINYNPVIIFTPEEASAYNDQLVKATNLVVSSLRFMRSLREEILEPEVFHLNPAKSDNEMFRSRIGWLPRFLASYGAYYMKAFPLDMSQYPHLFNTTRIPEPNKDRIVQDVSGKHIVVMRRGHFYKIDVLDENGRILPAKEIAASLKAVLEDQRGRNELPPAVMTTAERNHWAEIRKHLEETGNKDVLKKVDSAILVLNLDDDDDCGSDYKKLLRLFLHEDGVNRWYDKSISLLISKDGYSAVNFEHSWGDGVAVLRYLKDVKADIGAKPRFHPEDVANLNAGVVERLEFNLDEKSVDAIKRQKDAYRNWTQSLGVNYYLCEDFGKEECKKLKISPDCMMQLGFQLAIYKQLGHPVATYESGSTAAFKHGRTETVRSCTKESTDFCAAITAGAPMAQLKEMIVKCSTVHGKLVKEAAMGLGFDRHLFALRKIAERKQMEVSIFKDPAYAALNYNILSTSTLSDPAVLAGGFGPVVDDGYGIGYMIQDHKLGATVTNYKAHRDGDDYIRCLESAFQDIRRVITCK